LPVFSIKQKKPDFSGFERTKKPAFLRSGLTGNAAMPDLCN